MRRAAILFLLAAGCESGLEYSTETAPVHSGPRSSSVDVSGVRDWGELDRFGGQQVTITGIFTAESGAHASVTLDSGLKVYLPHFDLWGRDQAWFRYGGRRVAAGGILHTSSFDLGGRRGPSVEINAFQLLE